VTRRRYGTGSLYKRGNTWWIAYHVQGKHVRESARTSVRREAEAFLRERLHGVDQGKATPTTARTTLADLERLVVNDYKAQGRRTTRNVRQAFKHLAAHFGSERKAREITGADVEAYKAARLGSGAAHATVNAELAQLRRGFRLAIRHGLLATRPDFSLRTPRNARQGFFEADDLASLLPHLPDWLAPVVRFMYLTGWRRTEVLTLEWRQVDRRRRIIRIEATKNDEPRTLPYGPLPELGAILDEQWARHEAYQAGDRLVPWVFPGARGGRIHDYSAAWKRATATAGLVGRIPHDFRRTAVRNLERAGVPRSVAMQITGHKTESIYKRYAIVNERDVADGLAKLAEANRGPGA